MRVHPQLLLRFCGAAVAAALAAGCPKNSSGPDAGPDAGPDGGVRAHPTPGPGQAAAWQVADPADLATGPSAAGRVGDWVIANGRVRFVIEGARASDGYDPYGCAPIAADRQRAKGEAGESRFGEMVFLFNFRGAGCDFLDLVSDGSDDGTAALRATGRDQVLPYAASLFSQGTEPPPLNATIFRDYALAPDSDVLQLTLTIRNDGDSTLSLDAFYAAMAMNRGLRNWVPGSGFDFSTLSAANPRAQFYAAVGERVSYSLLNLESPFSPITEFAKILFGQYAGARIGPGQAKAVRFLIGVGTGDVGSLQQAHAAALGIGSNAAVLAGAVVGPAGEPVAGARVHIMDSAGAQALSMARTGADGRWSAALSPASYLVRAVADDRANGPAQTVSLTHDGISNLTLPLGGSAKLDVAVTDERGPVPAKIVAEPLLGYGRGNLPAVLGEWWDLEPIVSFAPAGTATLPVFPSQWKVTCSRGFEYDVAVAQVQTQAGASTPVRGQIHRVVDTSGWISGDFHVHAQNSIDGTDLLTEKVRAFAAEGVEVPVSTEHEYVGDFGPAVRALGLGAFMHALAGTELTTTFIGHFNVFPLVPQAAAVNQGAFQWYGRNVPDVIAEARLRRTADGLVPIVQMNHPRTLGMAYLDALQFDPGTFTVQGPNAAHFMSAWDAMEIWNGGPLERFEGCPIVTSDGCVPASHPTLFDWFSFLDRGLRVTATGNSDSHAASFQETGYPRTYLRVAADDPATVQDPALLAALRGQQAVISGGPFLTISAPGASGPVGPGGIATVDASGAQPVVKLSISVQAPTWMGPLSRVDIWVGDANAAAGATLAMSLDLTSGTYKDDGTKVQRLAATVPVPVPANVDTWVIVTVRGANADALWPVVQAHVAPFGMTNPIWVDGTGDGLITPLR